MIEKKDSLKEYVVLVDENGNVLGKEEKLKAHQEALLHQAFSILIYRDNGDMLIHRRAAHKYHSANLWSNACCSHPRPTESLEKACQRRLQEELGFVCPLDYLGNFTYKFFDEASKLTEHELDAVYSGKYDGEVNINEEEMSEIKWISIKNLKQEITESPEEYTYWFKRIIHLFL